MIGFIRKFTLDFKNCSVILYLYKSLVLPILMYASPIWSPHVLGDQYRFETVQHKFLRYLSFENGQAMDPFSHDYSNIMSLYSVPTLMPYRDLRDVLFAFKIINECIDCDTLCQLFKQRQLSYELRNHRLFKEERFNANYTSDRKSVV